MSLKSLLRAGSFSALTAALAFGAVSASAQDEPERNDRRAGRTEARQLAAPDRPRAEVSEARQQQRQERREARAVAVPSAPIAVAQRTRQAPAAEDRSGREWNRSERSGRDWNRRDNASNANSNNDWGPRRAAQAQADAQARAAAQAEAQARVGVRTNGWDGRRSRDGSTSGNRDRNRTYRDGTRSSTYQGSRQQNGWRDGRTTADTRSTGYRDGAQTQHYRDGQRWDGRRDGSRSWSRDWRRDNRYNWYGYRSSNRHLFSLGRYYSPYSNYRYSRVSIGFRLGSLFFGSRYWINDPWQYRLPEAYGPYRWVRYYDDALLVDIYSGEVVDVIYDFFW